MNETESDIQRYWDGHASSDPLWAVLSFPDKRGGRWSIQEFMKSGEREIALLFHRIKVLGLTTPTKRVLDFGCGVGRLTQALGRRSNQVIGADISPIMVGLANRLNQYSSHVSYLCTAERDIDSLEPRSFELIYSNIVLQHVPAELSMRYIESFFRLLAPNGLLVFQLPSHRDPIGQAEIKPMPEAAYRASIQPASPTPQRVTASEEFSVTVHVRNDSPHEWSQPSFGPLALGNHWLDAGGDLMLVQDDGRSPLLQTVPPGLEWPVLLTMRAPAAPGIYVIEIDTVHEGVSWFSHKGSSSLRFSVEVTEARSSNERAPLLITELSLPDYPSAVLPRPLQPLVGSASGDFPMNGVHRNRVLEMIKAHGGTLAYVEEDRRAGPEWVSYRYFVTGKS